MSSAFEQRFAASAGRLLRRQHGTSITYTPAGAATGTPVTGIVGAEAAELLEEPGSRVSYKSRCLTVFTDEVANPLRGDVATIGGEKWTVHEVESVHAGQARLRVIQPVRVETGGRRLPGR